MARPLKLELAGGLYHVTSRGDRRENIYDNDEDREKWLENLSDTCRRFNWRCHTYCLMGNHYHIVIETAEANLSKGMRQLNGVYTQYYNRQHGRVGHVFQGRYKSIGSEKFINNNQKQIRKKKTLNDVPRLQKRKLPKSLEYYENTCHDQKKAILNAYISGGYTLKEIGDYFGKHYSTISRIVKACE